MKFSYAILGVILLVSIHGCKTVPIQPFTPIQLNATGTYQHADTGFSFPESIGSFMRSTITKYDAEAKDVGVNYAWLSSTHSAVITVNIYPFPKIISIGSSQSTIDVARERAFSNHFEEVKQEIFKIHPTAQIVKEENVAHKSLMGKKVTFQFRENFVGKKQIVNSDFILFASGNWFLKTRISTSDPRSEVLAQEVTLLLKRLGLNDGSGKITSNRNSLRWQLG